MIDDLKLIRIFLQVARLGSFAEAARSLRLTPASVTRSVARLEQDVGAQLLVRTTRSVALTAEGAALSDRFAPIVAAFDQASADLHRDRQPDRGTLRISAPLSFGVRLMPPILDRFRLAYPRIDLRITLSDRMSDVMDGRHDLVIRISAPPRDKSTIWRKLCAVPRCLVASPALFARMPQPRHPDDLDPSICLGYTAGDGTETWRLRRASQHRQISAGQSLGADNGDLLADLAANGAGVALLPDFIVHDALAQGRLVRVLPDWQVPQLWLSLTYPAYTALPPLVATFSDFFEASLHDVGGLEFGGRG